MRITRETLLKLARDTAAQRVRQTARGLHLPDRLAAQRGAAAGWHNRYRPDLRPSTNDPEKPREMVRLTDEVHLDIAHLSQSIFHQPRHLRLGCLARARYLCSHPLVLHDTHHWFEFTQASAFSQFFRPENVMERSRPAADAARQTWLELHSLTGAPDAHARWAYLKALENAANAIAVLNGPPLTERRFMLQFPQRAQTLGRPGLAGGLVDLYMPEKPDAETWQMWLENWRIGLQRRQPAT